MNEGVLCRGKRLDTGAWVEGYYVHLKDPHKSKESHRIYTGYAEVDCGDWFLDWWEIDPDTVGRCAGLTDKNGKKIFEGDIVSECPKDNNVPWPGVVRWDADHASFGLIFDDGEFRCLGSFDGSMTIIGNIHDNPELTEERNG